MTVIRPNSVSGITSITAQANEINFFRSNGTLAGLQLNGVNFNTTTGVSTFNNLDVGGVLTYQDVTNVDSVGIITARSTIDAQGDVSIADKIIHTGDTNTAIRFPAADTITAETAGSERLRITSDGKVGIGHHIATQITKELTIRPADGGGILIGRPGDTVAPINVALQITTRTSGSEAYHTEYHTSNCNALFSTYEGGGTGGNFIFQTGVGSGNDVERLRITSDGNIGINVTPTNYSNYVTLALNDTTGSTIEGRVGGTLTGSFSVDSLVTINAVTSIPMVFKTANTERLRITSAGKVGINEGSPAADLVVKQSGNTFTTQSQTVALFQRSSTSGHGAKIAIVAGTGGSSDINFGDTDDEDIGKIQYYHTDNSFRFTTNTTEKLRINSDGIVTKPYNPAFIAGRTGGNQTFTVGTFPLNVARLNVGNHYNTSTYKFTAPVAGVYYFFAQVYYNNGSGAYRIGFRKTPNGGSAFMLNTAQHAMVGNDNQQSISIIESLAVGDTVALYSDQNASIQCYYNINDNTFGAHTYFMGYLIG